MNIHLAEDIIKKRAGETLFRHCLGVKNTAVQLAKVYGVDPEKAALTGMLHDYGKLYSNEELARIARRDHLDDPLIYLEPVLLHAPVGALLLQEELAVEDPAILEAVRVHTTGFPGMSLLAQIIYVADYIEPQRTCPGVQAIRKLAFIHLQEALLAAVDFTIQYVLARNKLIHPHSIAFRNDLIQSMKTKCQELSVYDTKEKTNNGP